VVFAFPLINFHLLFYHRRYSEFIVKGQWEYQHLLGISRQAKDPISEIAKVVAAKKETDLQLAAEMAKAEKRKRKQVQETAPVSASKKQSTVERRPSLSQTTAPQFTNSGRNGKRPRAVDGVYQGDDDEENDYYDNDNNDYDHVEESYSSLSESSNAAQADRNVQSSRPVTPVSSQKETRKAAADLKAIATAAANELKANNAAAAAKQRSDAAAALSKQKTADAAAATLIAEQKLAAADHKAALALASKLRAQDAKDQRQFALDLVAQQAQQQLKKQQLRKQHDDEDEAEERQRLEHLRLKAQQRKEQDAEEERQSLEQRLLKNRQRKQQEEEEQRKQQNDETEKRLLAQQRHKQQEDDEYRFLEQQRRKQQEDANERFKEQQLKILKRKEQDDNEAVMRQNLIQQQQQQQQQKQQQHRKQVVEEEADLLAQIKRAEAKLEEDRMTRLRTQQLSSPIDNQLSMEDENHSLRLRLASLQQQQQRQQQEYPYQELPGSSQRDQRSTQRDLRNQLPTHQSSHSQMYSRQHALNNLEFEPQMRSSSGHIPHPPQWDVPPPRHRAQNHRADILALLGNSMQAETNAATMYYSNLARETHASVYANSLVNIRSNVQTLTGLLAQCNNEY
jgi:hypothetical protein